MIALGDELDLHGIPGSCACVSLPRDKKPVKKVELWQRLDALAKEHHVDWHWVKGHAGHPENERADELAREGMAPFKG